MEPWYREQYQLRWGDYGWTYWHGEVRFEFDPSLRREFSILRRAGTWLPQLSFPANNQSVWCTVTMPVLEVLVRHSRMIVKPVRRLEICRSDWREHWAEPNLPRHLSPKNGEPYSALAKVASTQESPELWCVKPQDRVPAIVTDRTLTINGDAPHKSGVCLAGKSFVWLWSERVVRELRYVVDPEVIFIPAA